MRKKGDARVVSIWVVARRRRDAIIPSTFAPQRPGFLAVCLLSVCIHCFRFQRHVDTDLTYYTEIFVAVRC